MVLVMAAPLVPGEFDDQHTIVSYVVGGPRASAVTWEYTPIAYGMWTGVIENHGLRWLVVDNYDNTSGSPVEIFHQRIRFAAYDAYPTGVVEVGPVVMAGGHVYEITGTPSGPKMSYCIVTDTYEGANPPVAAFTYTMDEATVYVDGSGSSDIDGTVVDYMWDWGDGSMMDSGVTAMHTYAADGWYTITLTVTDNEGLTGSSSQDVYANAPNIPPVAMFTTSVYGLDVTADASGSYDPDGVIVSYDWDWGDGSMGSGVIATHTYAMSGLYTVQLTVTDNEGASGTASADVLVEEILYPPVALFTYTTDELTVNVDGSGSYDPDGTIASYAWDWGDGSVMDSGITAMHTYAMDGTYTITLTVTDDDGLTGTASADVSLATKKAPVAMFTETVLWLDVSVDASGSYDPDGTIESYAWDWGDGSTGSGVTATHSYAMEGTYTITLTVTDNDGMTGTATKDVSVSPEPLPPVAMFTVSTSYLVVSVDASGSYDPDGMIVSYDWDWGDGSTGSGVTATHTYAMEGTYTITLVVTDDDSMTDDESKQVTLSAEPQPPVAMFTASVSYLTVDVDASGSYDPDGSIVSYGWDWGDGSTGSGVTATHKYAAAGTYTITLVITDDDGLTGTASMDVTTSPEPIPPVAAFTTTVDFLDVHVDASGSYDPDGTIVSYDWDWGDGATGSGMTATHTYAMEGTYTITLTVTDNDGATGTASEDVYVRPAVSPVAMFTTTVLWLDVSVDASGSYDPDGTVVSYDWDWGDGSTGSGVTATHKYAADGTYTITLTVTDNDGLTGTASESVSVRAPVPPVAMFTTTVEWLEVSVDASGSYDSDGTIVSYAWDWGDGSTGSGVTATHSYAMKGTYTITLTVTDNDGLTGSASEDVYVRPAVPPVAMFTTTVLWLDVSVDASGSSDSDGTIVSYDWDWGDGSTGTGVTASHTYASAGTYTIILTVTDNDGLTGTASEDVSVRAPVPPVAMFTVAIDWLDVSVDATGSYDSDGTIVSYAWDWGDGSTGSGVTATHSYAMEGTYTITLTVTDNDGLTGSASEDVYVRPPVPPVATFATTVLWLDVSVDASGSSDSDGTIVSYAWDWGDGSTGSGVTASHSYSVGGTYTITLTVTDNDGLTGSASTDVFVEPEPLPPVAKFTTTVTWLDVSVDARDSYDPDGIIVSYGWDWGDGSTGSGATATHTYAMEGTYTITLVVTDDDGLTGTASVDVFVEPEPIPPVAMFTLSSSYLEITVDASGSYDSDGLIVSYDWDWGDGSTGSGVTATHTYASAGTYTVTLTVTDDDGLTGSASTDVTVEKLDNPPTADFTYTVDGMTVYVDASRSTDDFGIVSYDWDWGDGTTGSGITASHTYSSGKSMTTSSSGKAPPPPYSVFGYTYGPDGVAIPGVDVVVTNKNTSYYLTTVSDEYGFYSVDLNTIQGGWQGGNIINVTATYGTLIGWNESVAVSGGAYLWIDVHLQETAAEEPMVVTITLTVTDTKGQTASISKQITLEELQSPVASFTVVMSYLDASVDASGSYDPDGTIVSYAWDWGDGTTGTGVTATHTYSAGGTYTITLTVTDNDGLTGTSSQTVTAEPEPVPPVASFTYTLNWLEVSVDGRGSSDSDGMIVSYDWSWGDGTTGTGATATHTYAAAGTYTITLTVTDDDGLTDSTSLSVTVEAEPVPPVAMFTVSVNWLDVSVDASGSYDSDGTIVSYAWDWGDGSTGTGMTATHTYATDGTYTITLTVTDDDGLTGTASTDVTVEHEPIPPSAEFTYTADGLTVNVDATGSSDPDGTIVSYDWSWGDGTTGTGVTATHTYSAGGTYTIALTVTDDDGLQASASADVTVEDPNAYKATRTISNMFELYMKSMDYSDLGRWNSTMGVTSYWNLRVAYQEYFVQDTYPFLYAYNPYSTRTTPDVSAGFVVTTWYRMYTEAKNLEGMGTDPGKDPVFLPVLGDPSLPGGTVDIRWYSTYLTTQEMKDIRAGVHYANTYYGVPTRSTPSESLDDGYWHELQGIITFDRATAKKILGLPGAGDLRDEFLVDEFDIEGYWWDNWLAEGGGIYDIYTAYDYSDDIRWLELLLDPASTADTLVLRFWSVSWGNEVLLVRYLEKVGVWSKWQAWPDDWYLNITIGPTKGDVESRSVMGYHMTAWQDQTNPSLAAWSLETVHIDWCGNDQQHQGYQTPYNAYDPDQTDVKKISYLPGTMMFGQEVSYWLAPQEWDLAQGEKIIIKLPAGVVNGIPPYLGTGDDTLNSEQLDELRARIVEGTMNMGVGWPTDLGGYYDPATKTVTLVGPMDFPTLMNSYGVLETGSPTFMFIIEQGKSVSLESDSAEPAALEPADSEPEQDVLAVEPLDTSSTDTKSVEFEATVTMSGRKE
jgi:PKD repeat protein